MDIKSILTISKEQQNKIACKLTYSYNGEALTPRTLADLINGNPLLFGIMAVTSPDLTVNVPRGFVQLSGNNKIEEYFTLGWTEDMSGDPFYVPVAAGDDRTKYDIWTMFSNDQVQANYDEGLDAAYITAMKDCRVYKRMLSDLEKIKQDGYEIDEDGDLLAFVDLYFVHNGSGAKGVLAEGSILPGAIAQHMSFYTSEDERDEDYPRTAEKSDGRARVYQMPIAFSEELAKVLQAIAKQPLFNNHKG